MGLRRVDGAQRLRLGPVGVTILLKSRQESQALEAGDGAAVIELGAICVLIATQKAI